MKVLCTQQINNFIFNEPPQGQWFVENKIAGISLLAAFLGVAIAGSLHGSFQPADSDFALSLFELGIARHKFGLAGLRQRGGKDTGTRYCMAMLFQNILP